MAFNLLTKIVDALGNPFSITNRLPVQSQHDQPITDSQLRANKIAVEKVNEDLEQRSVSEGDLYPLTFEVANSIWNGATSSGGQNLGTISSVIGKALYIRTLTYTASRMTDGRAIYGSFIPTIGNYPTLYSPFVFGGISGASKIDVYGLLKNGQALPGLSVLSVFDADPRTTIALAVNGANYLLTTKASNNTTGSNNQYSNTITVTNNTGSATSGTITVTDKLPVGCRFVSGTGTGWTVSESGGIITATSTTVIANNGTSTITVTYAPIITTSYRMAGSSYLMDLDTDYNAPNIMPICGTSISNGTGPTVDENMYTWVFRNWLRDTKGYRIRRINRSISGSNSSHHEYLRTSKNRYNFDRSTGVFVYEHGINDVAQGIPTATTQANLLAMIKHKQSMYPNMTMLVLAPFPVSNSSNEAALAALSISLASTVASVGDSKVIYISGTRTCLDPSTDLVDGIHPSDTGNSKIASTLINACVNITF